MIFQLLIVIGVMVLLAGVPIIARLEARAARGVARLARHRGACVGAVFLFVLILGIIPALRWGVPLPNVHDEFAYLLAGDTFAHGRLANPPPPMPEFFQTFHEIQSPTYASKFPVGQGMALAVGFLLGQPMIGVWASVALACAAGTWAFYAAAPPRWALLGGVLLGLHPLTLWWSQSYWGGGVAMLGGALLLGAVLRARIRPRWSTGLLIGAGLAILANSRPFEGMIIAVSALTWLLVGAMRSGEILAQFKRSALPAAIVLMPVFAFMGYYNWRVTGDPLRMPYVEHQRQYMAAPLFFLQSPPSPHHYQHEVMRRFYTEYEAKEYRDQLGWRRMWGSWVEKWRTIAEVFMVAPTLAIPLLALLAIAPMRWWRRRGGSACAESPVDALAGSRSHAPNPRPADYALPSTALRLAATVCVLTPAIQMALTPWFRVTYMAPALPFFFLAVIGGLRRLLPLRIGSLQLGLLLVRVVVVAQLAILPWAADYLEGIRRPGWTVDRAELVQLLSARSDKSLVLVSYGPQHDPLNEWVFNDADIAGAKVVFARSMGEANDRSLIAHFKDRQLWRLVVNEQGFKAWEPR